MCFLETCDMLQPYERADMLIRDASRISITIAEFFWLEKTITRQETHTKHLSIQFRNLLFGS